MTAKRLPDFTLDKNGWEKKVHYCGIAGNFRALQRVHRVTEHYWRKMLSSRSHKGHVTWEAFYRIKKRYPLQRPKLYLPYRELQAIAVL